MFIFLARSQCVPGMPIQSLSRSTGSAYLLLRWTPPLRVRFRLKIWTRGSFQAIRGIVGDSETYRAEGARVAICSLVHKNDSVP